MKVRKAVILVAGFGTRFLPVTKAVPKMMLPVLDTPVLHLSVNEAVSAGIEQVIFVVSEMQESVESYFSYDTKLKKVVSKPGNEAVLEKIHSIPSVEARYVYQREQLGVGHAVLMAKEAVGDEPFALFFPDDVIWDETPTIGRMIEIFEEKRMPILAAKEVPNEMVSSLGIIEHSVEEGRLYRVTNLVEKPSLVDAPSNLAIIGRYVLTPEIFDALERTDPGVLGEIQLTDAIRRLLNSQSVYSYQFPGYHIDTGTPVGLLKASVHAALQRDDVALDLRKWLEGQF